MQKAIETNYILAKLYHLSIALHTYTYTHNKRIRSHRQEPDLLMVLCFATPTYSVEHKAHQSTLGFRVESG